MPRPANADELRQLIPLLALGRDVPTRVAGTLPSREGLALAADVRASDLGIPALEADVPSDLRALLGEYAFFHHGLLMLAGGLNFDPVELHYAERGLTERDRPLLLLTSYRLVYGLPEPWCRCLFACPLPVWEGLAEALGQFDGLDRRGRRYWKSVGQDLTVPAWSQLSEAEAWSRPDRIPVRFYAVDGSDACWHLLPARRGRPGPLFPLRSAPDARTRREAEVLFQTLGN